MNSILRKQKFKMPLLCSFSRLIMPSFLSLNILSTKFLKFLLILKNLITEYIYILELSKADALLGKPFTYNDPATTKVCQLIS